MSDRELRLQAMSDLHLELFQDRGRSLLERIPWDQGASALVLAGDIGTMGRLRRTLELAFEFVSGMFHSVFYVPGNHELYGCWGARTLEKLRKLVAQFPNITLLEPGVIARWGDRRVVGATLWFPYSPTNRDVAEGLADFGMIRGFVPWVYEQNRAHIAWLEEVVREGDIVVTHHLPSRRSVAEKYVNDPLNVFFVCDMQPLIEERQPALWVHGHTHESFRYAIGQTEVLCNPLGYVDEVNPSFGLVRWPT